MAFVKVERKTVEQTDAVLMGLYLSDSKAFKGRSVVFTIARSIIAKLGWDDSDNRVRVAVYEGVREDAGFFMIQPSDQGYTASAGNKGSSHTPLRFSVIARRLRHYTLNDTKAESQIVQHMIDGDSLIVECPEWLKINPLSGKPEKPVEVEPEPKLLPAFPETRVSHSVQQPPPGMPKRRGRPPKGGHRYS
jgi:hypothetical protein